MDSDYWVTYFPIILVGFAMAILIGTMGYSDHMLKKELNQPDQIICREQTDVLDCEQLLQCDSFCESKYVITRGAIRDCHIGYMNYIQARC